MRPHQHDIKMLRINTLVACRLMLCQIIQWEFRAAPCYCCAVIMRVLKGTDYNLRGLRLSQRFWWRLTLPECYTVCNGKALPRVSEERTAFLFRAKPYTKRPPQDMPMLSPSKAEWVDSFFNFSPRPSHLFALIFISISFTKIFLTVQQDATYSVYYNSVGSSTCFGCWHPSSGARITVITASGID